MELGNVLRGSFDMLDPQDRDSVLGYADIPRATAVTDELILNWLSDDEGKCFDNTTHAPGVAKVTDELVLNWLSGSESESAENIADVLTPNKQYGEASLQNSQCGNIDNVVVEHLVVRRPQFNVGVCLPTLENGVEQKDVSIPITAARRNQQNQETCMQNSYCRNIVSAAEENLESPQLNGCSYTKEKGNDQLDDPNSITCGDLDNCNSPSMIEPIVSFVNSSASPSSEADTDEEYNSANHQKHIEPIKRKVKRDMEREVSAKVMSPQKGNVKPCQRIHESGFLGTKRANLSKDKEDKLVSPPRPSQKRTPAQKSSARAALLSNADGVRSKLKKRKRPVSCEREIVDELCNNNDDSGSVSDDSVDLCDDRVKVAKIKSAFSSFLMKPKESLLKNLNAKLESLHNSFRKGSLLDKNCPQVGVPKRSSFKSSRPVRKSSIVNRNEVEALQNNSDDSSELEDIEVLSDDSGDLWDYPTESDKLRVGQPRPKKLKAKPSKMKKKSHPSPLLSARNESLHKKSRNRAFAEAHCADIKPELPKSECSSSNDNQDFPIDSDDDRNFDSKSDDSDDMLDGIAELDESGIGGESDEGISGIGGETDEEFFHEKDYVQQHKSRSDFTWFDGEGFIPREIPFTAPQGGIPEELIEDHFSSLNDRKNVLTYFMLTLPMDVVHLAVQQTNIYFQMHCNRLVNGGNRIPKDLTRWIPVDADTMLVFLALTMLMGHVRKSGISDYWSQDELTHTPIFAKYMSRNRYQLILRFLHFSDSRMQPAGDRLFKIREVIQMMNISFRTVYYPHKNLCIDESLLLFKGRIIFRQYIKTKRARYGIKFFVIADSLTGYVLCVMVYTSTGFEAQELGLPDTPEISRLNKPGQVVVSLMEDYLDKGHTLYTDNWYTSPYLFQYLLDRGTYAVGTVRHNCAGLPKISDHFAHTPTKKNPNPKSLVVKHTCNMEYVVWLDRKPVKMLTTEVKHEMLDHVDLRTGLKKTKPSSILSYNKNMGGVDLSDMQLSFVQSNRKTMKWYRKVFFHLLDLSVRNAFILFKEMNETARKMTLGNFRLMIIRNLLQKFGTPMRQIKAQTFSCAIMNIKGNKFNRLVQGGHYLRRIGRDVNFVPAGDGKVRKVSFHVSNQSGRRLNNFHNVGKDPGENNEGTSLTHRTRRCYVCSHTTLRTRRESRTSYECETCDIGLCCFPCFKEFHTMEVF